MLHYSKVKLRYGKVTLYDGNRIFMNRFLALHYRRSALDDGKYAPGDGSLKYLNRP